MEGPGLVSLRPEETVSQIMLNSDFVMMQLGDTLSLSVKVTAIDRSELPVDLEKIVWVSQDSSQVEVSRYGQLKAKVASNLPVRVIVSYKENLNTVLDTVQVYVTQNRLVGSNIKLIVLDSNRVGGAPSFVMLGHPRLRVDIFDNSENLVVKGASIPISTPAQVTSLFNPTGGDDNEPVYNIMNDAVKKGSFWVKSSVNLYGVPVVDSAKFIGLYPVTIGTFLFGNFIGEDGDGSIVPRIQDTTKLAPQIQPCGVFAITNSTTKPFDVVFSDSLSIGTCNELDSNLFGVKVVGGNILGLAPSMRGIRRVRTVGTVDYYLRDAVTKERLPVSGRYESVEPIE